MEFPCWLWCSIAFSVTLHEATSCFVICTVSYPSELVMLFFRCHVLLKHCIRGRTNTLSGKIMLSFYLFLLLLLLLFFFFYFLFFFFFDIAFFLTWTSPFYKLLICLQISRWVANSVAPNQTPQIRNYIVCVGLSIRILRVNTIMLIFKFIRCKTSSSFIITTALNSGQRFTPTISM